MNNCVIGLDFGTDSVRAILKETQHNVELATETYSYPRWEKQLYCDATENRFRQHPMDHIEGLEHVIKGVVRKSEVSSREVKGIGIVTTGSSPVPVDKEGAPLGLKEEFNDNPSAMMVLWKDHTATAEANRINNLIADWEGPNYIKYEGGIYSTEWFWAKILHIIQEDPSIKGAAYSWVEHCDLMTYTLTEGDNLGDLKRSRCAAGHKAMWNEEWNGLPSKEFLNQLDPYLGELKDRLYQDTYTSDEVAGNLSKEWAQKLGLTTDTVIAVGSFDAHAGAVGAIIEKRKLVRAMGTSTCDIMVSPYEAIGNKAVRGIAGQVDGSVIPGLVGLEAGQSAFGDLLAWFKDVLSWPLEHLVYNSDILTADQKMALQDEVDHNFINALTEEAKQIPLSDAVPVALDWINGRRTPDANQELKSAFTHLSLGSKAPHMFKSLVNAICFGAKKIVDRFEEEGVEIDEIIGIGGVARKSPYIMQTLSNVLNKPVKVASVEETAALGATIYASVAAELFPSVDKASKQLGSSLEKEYNPEKDKIKEYERFLASYENLWDFVETSLKHKKKE